MADKRALQTTADKNRGLIPPSEDQFFGQELKPQRSIVESILRYLYNPNDPGIGPTSLPIGAGIVATEKNIPIILQRLRQLGGLSPDMDPINYAKNYMMVKYPKLMGLPSGIYSSSEKAMGGAYGKYVPGEAAVVLNNSNSAQRNVETLGHELTHAIQERRGIDLGNPSFIPNNWEEYYNQPIEIAARKGGKTAIDTHQKIAEMILQYMQRK